MAKGRRDEEEEGEDQGGFETEPGPTEAAKLRAIELAKVQASDAEIVDVLVVEFASSRPARLKGGEITKRMRDWGPILERARTAGRLLPLEALRRAAEAGDVAAATALHKRQELLDGLDGETLRELKRLMALDPEAMVAELGRLAGKLRLKVA